MFRGRHYTTQTVSKFDRWNLAVRLVRIYDMAFERYQRYVLAHIHYVMGPVHLVAMDTVDFISHHRRVLLDLPIVYTRDGTIGNLQPI